MFIPIILRLIVTVSRRERRLVGAPVARPGQFKYAVALQRNNRTICTGSIIDDEYVLTAAHCIINSRNEFKRGKIVVVAGTNDVQAKVRSRRERAVIKMYAPESYRNYPSTSQEYAEGDIAVLKVN